MASFVDLARMIGATWKSADEETRLYCSTVARLIRERQIELSEAGGTCHLSTKDSFSPGSEARKQQGDNTNQMNDSKLTESGVMHYYYLPTIDSVSVYQAIETKKKELQRELVSIEQAIETKRREMHRYSTVPRRASCAFSYQRTNGSCVVPESSSPHADEQGTGSHKTNRKCAPVTMYQQDHQVATDTSTTMTRDNANLDFSASEMRCPNMSNPRQVIQAMQPPMIGGRYGDNNELQFSAIADAYRMDMLSNVMFANNRSDWSYCSEVRSFGQQRRWSTPECVETQKQEPFNNI